MFFSIKSNECNCLGLVTRRRVCLFFVCIWITGSLSSSWFFQSYKMRLCPLAFAVLLGLFHLIQACNHWVLREEQIVPKLDSPFHMREPHNLAAFLKQIRYSEYVERSIWICCASGNRLWSTYDFRCVSVRIWPSRSSAPWTTTCWRSECLT